MLFSIGLGWLPEDGVVHKESTARGLRRGPLSGIRVVDLSRLAPGPYATMLLGDLGAEVICVGGGRAGVPIPELARGKRQISLDLRSAAGQRALHALVETADVFVEGFRPGAAARIGAGYEQLAQINPRLIYCSLTGYGQSGPRAQEAGHDINYLGVSGILGMLGPREHPPVPPLNLVADFAGGSLFAAMGVIAALYERERSGKGQFLDAAMVDGCLSMMAMHFPLWKTNVIPGRGKGLFDAPFYRTYACADGRFVAVGALERAFFEAIWRAVGTGDAPDHMNTANWPFIEETLGKAFKAQSRDHWASVFAGSDACVTPVLEPDEVDGDVQFAHRHQMPAGERVPVAPIFSRTPGQALAPDGSDQTAQILREAGVTSEDIADLTRERDSQRKTGLDWPPPFTSQTNNKIAGGAHERDGPGHV